MKKLIITAVLIMTLASIAPAMELHKGQFFLGPTLGLAYRGFGIGANGEYMFTKNWGGGGELAYTSFSEDFNYFGSYSWKYKLIGALAFASYHFNIKNEKLDPYLKGGLGYFHWSVSNNYNGNVTGVSAGYSSGLGVEGAAGIHYFFKPNMAGRVQVGFPFYLSVGVDFGIGSK